MQRKVLRRVMLAVPAVALGLTTSVASAQVTSTTGWRTVKIVSNQPDSTVLFSVAAGNASHAWAVGAAAPTSGTGNPAPVVAAWNGHAWAQVPSTDLPSTAASALLDSVSAGGPNDMWAFGFDIASSTPGLWLHWDGTTWTAGHVPGAVVASSLTIGPSVVWAFGVGSGRLALPYAAFHTSTGWKRTPVPGHGSIVGASAVTTRDIWAVIGSGGLLGGGTGRSGALLHWFAGHWHTVATLPTVLRNGSLGAVLARSDRNVWVGGAVKNSKKGTTEAVGHWNGHRWTVTTLHALASIAKWHLVKMVTDGSGGIWALGQCVGTKCPNGGAAWRLWHEVAGRWGRPVQPKLARTPTVLLSLAATGKSVWGAGAKRVTNSANGLIALWGPTP
jgi:hypothetical protein